LTAFSCF